MAKTSSILPLFVSGSYENIIKALQDGGVFSTIDRVIYCYITSGEHAGEWCYIPHNKTMNFVVGNNTVDREAISNLTESLQTINSAIQRMDENISILNTDISEIQDKIAILDTLSDLPSRVEAIEQTVNGYDNIINQLEEQIAIIPAIMETVNNNTERINNKADKATTLEGYGIIDGYTKDEVDELLGKADLNGNTVPEYVTNSINNAMELNVV